MSTNSLALLGAWSGVAVVGGLVLLVAVLRGWRPRPRAAARARRGRAAFEELPAGWRENYRLLLAGAVVAAVVVWVVTGWPVNGVLVAAGVAGLPFVLHPGGSAQKRVDRLEGLAQWLQQMASMQKVGIPLEETITSSAGDTPAGLRGPVRGLAGQLQQGVPPNVAYRRFADELEDGAVDHVVLLFMDHTTTRGRGMADTLVRLAESIASKAEGLRQVDAERAKVRSTARIISLFLLAVVTLVVVNPTWSAPYGTALGQGLLCLFGGMFVVALRWMRSMAQHPPEPRLLDKTHDAPRPLRRLKTGEEVPGVLPGLGGAT